MAIHSVLACTADFAQSTLMSKLTGTHSEVSAIDFTTLTTVPGTVKVHGAPIQILDLRMSFSHPSVRSLISSQLVSSRVRMMAVVAVVKVCALDLISAGLLANALLVIAGTPHPSIRTEVLH